MYCKGIKVLNRRHVESYILDDEIITKLCNAVGKPDKIAECITAKTEKSQQVLQEETLLMI